MFRLKTNITIDLERKAIVENAAIEMYQNLASKYLFFNKSMLIDSILAYISQTFQEPLSDSFKRIHICLIEDTISIKREWETMTVINCYDSVGKLNFVHDTFFFVNN